MKATFPLKPLVAACSAVSPIVPSRTTKDILKNLKITVDGDLCSISATDSETSATKYLRGVECQRKGVILLPCEKLMKILRESTGDNASVDCINGVASITVGRSKFKIPTEDPDKFPPLVEFTESAFRTIKGSDMAQIIRRCNCANPTDRVQAFGGIHFEIKEKLTAIACDSKCMSLVECDYTTDGKIEEVKSQTIVPPKSLKIISYSLSDDDKVDFSITENSIKFRFGDTTLSTQLIQGRYPDWRRVVPVNCPTQIPLVVSQFSNALRQAMITTAPESCGVNIRIANNNMALESNGSGECVIELPVSYEGEEHELRIDPQFLLSGISLVDKESTVTLNMTDGGSPVLLTSDDNLRWVAVPLTVS